MSFIIKLCFILLFFFTILINCSKKWSNGRIPYILDQKLRKNNYQKKSLFNTLVDLNNFTCLKFIPKTENDTNYVEFRYYSRNPRCWNFLTYTNGLNIVTAGPSCLTQNSSVYRHIFTDCDIQYINLFYNCPKFIPQMLDCDSSYTIPIDKKLKNHYKFNEKKQKWTSSKNMIKKIRSQNTFNITNFASEYIKNLIKLYKEKNKIPSKLTTTEKYPLSTIKSTTMYITKTTPFITTTPLILTTTINNNILQETTTTKKTNITNDICEINCNFNAFLKRLFVLHNENFYVRDTMLESDTLSLKQLQTDNYLIKSGEAFIANSENNGICSCTVPLYRLFNSIISDHFYTTNETELKSARTLNGYKFEKIEGYCTQNFACGALLPLYRFYNPLISDHLYTTDEKEMLFYRNNLIHGYFFEKIECYLWDRKDVIKYCSK
ncbi:Astacin-like metalloendopeptidase [Strongyloides ratti]|uniref:Astacin-like metalloendopeptidase n=1 Tax=Strongyloides ratti TaxID=34506 RepID=A0A090N0H2_STRRB|nr:Astacin-like metalloendopeptidase [Strongyloides ratti]CEF70683.1 Astacin-like metalloendopeptidase [Strongyloides ratti]